MAISVHLSVKVIVLAASFLLLSSERSLAQPEGSGAIMAIEEKPSAGGGRAAATTAEGQGKIITPARSSALPPKTPAKTSKVRKQVSPRPANVDANGRYLGPVLGDSYSFLNFEMAEKVQPVWTIAAKNAGALGLVQVVVLIGEDGEVLQAKARSGNALFIRNLKKLPLASRFNKPTENGRPARALGFIVYRFGTEEQEYEQEQKNKHPNLLR